MHSVYREYDELETLEIDGHSSRPQEALNTYKRGAAGEHSAARLGPEDRLATVSRIGRMPSIQPLSYFILLVLSVVPLALLLGFSGQIDKRISESACTPGGDFVMPFDSSIWDGNSFFEITIPFSGPETRACSRSVLNPFDTHDCRGYAFTEVKIMDLAWDVLVGRIGQALLVFVAYRVFSRVIVVLMDQGEVAYDAFAAVAFDSGSLYSLVPLFRQCVGLTQLNRSSRAIWCYIGMLFATMYIISVPSFISALTGYTTIFRPFARLGSAQGVNGTLVDCYPGFLPAWGRMRIAHLEINGGQAPGIYAVPGSNTTVLNHRYGDMWIECEFSPSLTKPRLMICLIDYNHYSSVYEECPKALDISSCAAAQRITVLRSNYSFGSRDYQVASPMPGILPYNSDTDTQGAHNYRYWQCGYALIDSRGLVQSPDFDVNTDLEEQSVGVCQADRRYAWGFSFLFAFLVAVLHLVFALLMYGLWLVGRVDQKNQKTGVASGTFPDAVTMVTQAQKQYGTTLDEWSAKRLKRDIVGGKIGMSYSSGKSMERRIAGRGQASDEEC